MTETPAASPDCRPAAEAAATWWTQQAVSPTFRNTSAADSPRDQVNGDMAGAMASMLAGHHPVGDETAERFQQILAVRIERSLASQMQNGTWKDRLPSLSIGVDYGPDRILADSAQEAGVHGSRFPWKTNMWVYPTHVVASLGYGAPSRIVWSAEDWERPVCAAGSYDESGERLPWKCSAPLYHDGEGQPHQFDVPDPLCATCNRPAGGYMHEPEIGWQAPQMHEFVPAQ